MNRIFVIPYIFLQFFFLCNLLSANKNLFFSIKLFSALYSSLSYQRHYYRLNP